MSIDLDVFSRARPDLNRPLGLVKLEPLVHDRSIEFYRQFEFFRWFKPLDKEEISHWIELRVPLSPSIFRSEVEVYPSLFDGKTRDLPPSFSERLRKEQFVTADEESYELLKAYPKLESQFPEMDLIWGLLKLNQGKPTYQTRIETPIWAPQRTIVMMSNLSRLLADQYEGEIWDPRSGRLGNVDPRERFESASNFFGKVAGLMEISGYTVDKEIPDSDSRPLSQG